MSDYHLFKKSVKSKNGSVQKKWYYWYYDAFEKQVKKSCRKCTTKREAELFISNLPPLTDITTLTISDITKNMYIPNSSHRKRLEQFGKILQPNTIRSKLGYIKYINDSFGDRELTSITMKEVQSYLFSVDKSGSWKNCYLDIFKEIYEEATWLGCKIQIPTFTRFKRNIKKQSILSTNELKLLFKEENFYSHVFFTMFLVILSCGLRLGEARALQRRQFLQTQRAILLDGFLLANGKRTSWNKSGSIDNPKIRVVLLPDITFNVLYNFIQTNDFSDNDYLFTYNNKPIRHELAEKMFYRALDKAGISRAERKITPHALRYTYVTRMNRLTDATNVMLQTGHTSIGMNEYYKQTEVEENLKLLAPLQSQVNKFFE